MLQSWSSEADRLCSAGMRVVGYVSLRCLAHSGHTLTECLCRPHFFATDNGLAVCAPAGTHFEHISTWRRWTEHAAP